MGENKGSKLFVTTVLDVKDDLEEKMERCRELLKQVTNSLSDREAHDALVATVCKGSQQHEEITVGLLYSVLTEPLTAAKTYRDLSMISRDGMMLAWSKLNQLIVEKFMKLKESPRAQCVWITREMVKNSVTGVDNVCSSLIKQIAGGDLSPKNMWLAEAMLDLFMENRVWLEKFPVLMCMALFTYLRVIEDHNAQTLSALRQKEVEFCITLLRNKFMECCRIGRDLLRLLQNVARIPEFELLWKDILHKPQAINPQFGGVPQLMGQRTSPKYLACRLTPDMEKKVVFLTSKVKFGQQKRYQDWFQKQYLSTPESQSLRCDLIRYICCAVHPSNEVLCSDIIQRWAVIGWLLTTCTSNVAASSAKLALFYDWLFFIQSRANIMDIEPAILVMHHSMRSHPAITATLLDFLCRIIPNFYPPLTSQVKLGVMTSLKFILDKRVLPSLSPLFDNPKLDKELRSMIRETFKEFCTIPDSPTVPTPKADLGSPTTPLAPSPIPDVQDVEVINESIPAVDDTPAVAATAPIVAENSRPRLDSIEGTFSDDEEEKSPKTPTAKEMVFRPIQEEEEEVDLEQYLDQLDGDIKELCETLQNQKDADLEMQCETMENLCTVILEADDFDSDTASPLASFLTSLYNPHMAGEILPEEITDETMEDSLGKPMYVIFRNLSQDTEDDSCPLQLLTLVCIMYEKHIRVGYNLLYHLHSSSKPGESKLHVYEEVCKNTESGSLAKCLVKDFKACQEEDVRLLCYLVTPIYTQFPDTSIDSTELLNTIAACIDSLQLQDLICDIMQGNLVMFQKDAVAATIERTLDWETFEQYCVWQLLDAHDFEVELLIPILPKLNYRDHPEALASMLLLLKLERASIELLKPLFCRNCKNGDRFTSAILSYWALQDEGHLADLTKTLIMRATTTAKRLRQRSQTSKQLTNPTPEKLLGHLDALRQQVASKQTMFFSQEAVLQGLQHIQPACTDEQKARFSDLFALADELDDMSSRTTRSRLARRSPGGASPRGRKTVQNNEPESSSESEQDDEVIITKAKPAKRRKKSAAAVGGSDSD